MEGDRYWLEDLEETKTYMKAKILSLDWRGTEQMPCFLGSGTILEANLDVLIVHQ